MKAGSSVYRYIHSFIKGKCSRRYKKAQEGSVGLWKAQEDSGKLRKSPEGSGRLRKAPEMNIKHRHKQCILTYLHDNEISCDIVVLSS